jgi:hypothetical protein
VNGGKAYLRIVYGIQKAIFTVAIKIRVFAIVRKQDEWSCGCSILNDIYQWFKIKCVYVNIFLD